MTTEILKSIPIELIEANPQFDVIAPSFREISDLAKVDGVDLRVLVVKEQDIITACAACYIENRRHHGLQLKMYELFGYLLHDYSRIYALNEESLDLLLDLAVKDAKSQKCDLMFWSNIPQEFVPGGKELELHTEIKIFSAMKNENGWKELYDRKSVKQSRRMAARAGEYRVEIIDGLVPDDLMEQMGKAHIERWKFSGSDSPFNLNPKRKQEYTAHPENKHYLRILVGDDVLASHYGMKYGKTLLLHTPIINPKYLKESPMRLLIAETAKYCEDNGLEAIDFGHGDEAYKDGYCTLPRCTYRLNRPITLKGKVSKYLSKVVNEHLKSKIGLIRRILKKEKKPILFFINNKPIEMVNANGITVITNWWDFYDFASIRSYPLDMECYKRFLHDKSTAYIAVTDENTICCGCWKTEMSDDVYLNGATLIYDFAVHGVSSEKIQMLFEYCVQKFGMVVAKTDSADIVKELLQYGFVQNKL